MSTDWQNVPLGDVAEEVTVGHVGPMASEYVPRGIPFLRSQNVLPHKIDLSDVRYISPDFHARLRKSALKPGDVVTVRTGKPGATAVVPGSLEIANCSDLVITRPGSQLDSRWLSYYINGAATGFVSSRLVGAVQQHFNVGAAKEMHLAMPRLTEQRGIAATLGALDDKIDSNRLARNMAVQLARAYVDRATAGRPMVSYGTALEVRMGSAFRGDAFSAPGAGRPLLRIRDLRTFESQIWTMEVRTDETLIQPGDIVVGMDADFRATLWLGIDSMLNQRVCTFRGLDGVGRAFVLAALEPELALQERAKTGTTVIHLNKADIEKFVVPKLSPEEHRKLAALTGPLMDFAVARAAEDRTLTTVRDTLLPELLSGRIRVPEAQEAVTEAGVS